MLSQGFGQGKIIVWISHLRVIGNQRAVEFSLCHERCNHIAKLSPKHHNCCLGITANIVKFGAAGHGVHRHHNTASVQYGIVRDEELRAVLHKQKHPVAGFQPLSVLKIPAQGFNHAQNRPVIILLPVKYNRRALCKAPRCGD